MKPIINVLGVQKGLTVTENVIKNQHFVLLKTMSAPKYSTVIQIDDRVVIKDLPHLQLFLLLVQVMAIVLAAKLHKSPQLKSKLPNRN